MDNIKYPVKIFSKLNANIIQILAFVIDSCNYDCFYCYNKRPRTNKQLNLLKLYEFIIKVHSLTNKYIHVDLIGGEPTLHPQLGYFCNMINNHKFIKCNIYTNLSCTFDIINTLILTNNIELSATYHYQSNKKMFIKKIKNISPNVNTNITIMYEPFLSLETIEMYQYLYKDTNLQTVELALILSDTKNKIVYPYSSEQIVAYNKICDKYKYLTKDEFIVQYSDGSIKEHSFYSLQTDVSIKTKFWKCWAGIEYFDITVDGDVYSCIESKKWLFNIIKQPINLFKIPSKPIICMSNYCQCRWDITKEKIFK